MVIRQRQSIPSSVIRAYLIVGSVEDAHISTVMCRTRAIAVEKVVARLTFILNRVEIVRLGFSSVLSSPEQLSILFINRGGVESGTKLEGAQEDQARCK